MTVGADAAISISGPWAHRSVSANGTRFHVAEAGEGPLVLLLHGFPEFWWTWRHQLAELPEAGFRAAAVDLRGYGGSDKPPRGYDLVTAASDAAGLIRAMGEANAIVVGHGLGGLIAWSLAAYYPKVVRRLAVVSMAHPLRMRTAMFTDPLGQGRRLGYALGFQLPVLPERQLLRNGAFRVGRPGPHRAGRISRPSRPTPGRCGYLRWRTRRLNITAGSRAAECGPTACATRGTCAPRSRPRPCTCTVRRIPMCCPRPLAAPGATSTALTAGG
jgi:pimeloyl-ACP methyl ester carboxylesterase